MEKRFLETRIYRHFKGDFYKVKYLAECSETSEQLVIYTQMKSDKIYARPLKMFMEKVDKNKYPNVEQKYRFELFK